MTLKPGDQLGPYEIEDTLGVGGMGEVYRAHIPASDAQSHEILPPELALDSERSARFNGKRRLLRLRSIPRRAATCCRARSVRRLGLIQRK